MSNRLSNADHAELVAQATFPSLPNCAYGRHHPSDRKELPSQALEVVAKVLSLCHFFLRRDHLSDRLEWPSKHSLTSRDSGSGSVHSGRLSYDATTRQTAQNAIQALGEQWLVAEAAFRPPLLRNSAYDATHPQTHENSSKSPGTILRPSLIWTWERPQALPSVIPFYVASKIGIPFIDEPVLLETLVGAALAALQDAYAGRE
eukprot:gene15492-21576_t